MPDSNVVDDVRSIKPSLLAGWEPPAQNTTQPASRLGFLENLFEATLTYATIFPS
jgi:hypothetical protein